MADVKISALPVGTPNADAILPATNAAGTTTEKLRLGAMAAASDAGSIPQSAVESTLGTDDLAGDLDQLYQTLGDHGSQHATGGGDEIANVVTSPSQITANQNDYAVGTGDIFRVSSDAARTITGIVAGTDGKAILLVNVGSHAITLAHESASSSANNRLTVPWAGNYVIDANGGAALLVYFTASNRWRVV